MLTIKDLFAIVLTVVCFTPSFIELSPLVSNVGWQETTGTVTKSYQDSQGTRRAKRFEDTVEYTYKTVDGVEHKGSQKSFVYWLGFTDISRERAIDSSIKVCYDKAAPGLSYSPDVALTFAFTHVGQGVLFAMGLLITWALRAMKDVGGSPNRSRSYA